METWLICLAVALIGGLMFSRITKLLHLPAVTAYLVAGLLLGPFFLGKLGVIVINDEDEELDEDTVMMDALEAGADDMQHEDTIYEIYTDPDAFQEVYNALEAAGYKFVSAQVEMVPQNYITVTDEADVKNLTKMLDMFEDNDDVQNVWHNWENAD